MLPRGEARRRGQEPEGQGTRAGRGLSFWLYGAIWAWYIEISGKRPSYTIQPWYPAKATPSFADALAELRRTLWRERISPTSGLQPLTSKQLTYWSKRSPLLHWGHPAAGAPSARLRKSTQEHRREYHSSGDGARPSCLTRLIAPANGRQTSAGVGSGEQCATFEVTHNRRQVVGD